MMRYVVQNYLYFSYKSKKLVLVTFSNLSLPNNVNFSQSWTLGQKVKKTSCMPVEIQSFEYFEPLIITHSTSTQAHLPLYPNTQTGHQQRLTQIVEASKQVDLAIASSKSMR